MSGPSGTFVAVGHVTSDITTLSSGETLRPELGGAVSFAASTARHHGLIATIVTSTNAPEELRIALPGVNVVNVSSANTTTFSNDYSSGERSQILAARASNIGFEEVPVGLRNPDVALISPLVREVGLDAFTWFPDSITGTILQGFLRRWDQYGKVTTAAIEPPDLKQKIELAVVSARELKVEKAEAWSSAARVVALTRGSAGVGIFCDGAWTDISSPTVTEVDPTGAGDVWAAAYLIRFMRTGNTIDSASFATRAAAHSVTAVGLAGIDQIPVD
ncbi:MAG: hypothetical protein HQ478_12005 [Chloroflexi bacterium]|nr:hypothetical protein [Chloroflexota bacterium]